MGSVFENLCLCSISFLPSWSNALVVKVLDFFFIFFIYSWLELLHFVIIVSIYIMMVNSVLYWKWKANWRQSRGQTSGLRFKNLIWYLVGGMIYTSVYASHTHSMLHTLFVCWTLLCKCGISLEDLLLNLNWSLWL